MIQGSSYSSSGMPPGGRCDAGRGPCQPIQARGLTCSGPSPLSEAYGAIAASRHEEVRLLVEDAVVTLAGEELGNHRCSHPFTVSRLSSKRPDGHDTGITSCR